MDTVYHVCVRGQQRPGHREDCRRCTPKAYEKEDAVSPHMIRGLAASVAGKPSLVTDINRIAEAFKALQDDLRVKVATIATLEARCKQLEGYIESQRLEAVADMAAK